MAFGPRASAKENLGVLPGIKPSGDQSNYKVAANCSKTTAKTDLDINNVRTTILISGDMWWDLVDAKYEVPKGSGKNSLYAGALWIGGIDSQNQLKLAAQTYRQSGSDFWGGPLDLVKVDIDANECAKYDRHWKMDRNEVEQFKNGEIAATPDIISWPGNGEYLTKNQAHYLAPFYDGNSDGKYTPLITYTDVNGKKIPYDYPYYDYDQNPKCDGVLFGDQTIWWVFNDVGNIHTETTGNPIGLEIRAQAFGFKTNDDINNMTFYNYEIFNRSSYTLKDTYFGVWVDSDLGYAFDDYVGCDVSRGLGYSYNGDAEDEGAGAYGINPPAVGLDFFRGPMADAHDGIDNNRNGVIDDSSFVNGAWVSTEQIIMSKFVYYNNDYSDIGNPTTPAHYYNYLKGFWKDGTPMTYGGSGFHGTTPCDFMFPGNTDPKFPGTPWTEVSANNTPNDRRFMQSAGKFTLTPGAVNQITVGVVWARASQGGPVASVNKLKVVDDKAQKLFDNCFKVVNGPDAPSVTVRELDKQVILTLENDPKKFSNNIGEKYAEKDPNIPKGVPDSMYKFQGYKVYQLKDQTVDISEISNPDKARLVAQSDVKDGVGRIVNYYYYDINLSLYAQVPTEMVNGADAGVEHVISLTTDAFAMGEPKLVNHKTYYYMAFAYAYNAGEEKMAADKEKEPFLSGRRNVKKYSAIPHFTAPENGGTVLNSSYNTIPKVTRIEGGGNGGQIMDIDDASLSEIIGDKNQIDFPVYVKGPVKVRVVDPMRVTGENFGVDYTISGDKQANLDTASWKLIKLATNDTLKSERNISAPYEQIFGNLGISVNTNQVKYFPGYDTLGLYNNGFLGASKTYSDSTKPWLSGISDFDGAFSGNSSMDWILAGSDGADATKMDVNQVYEKVLDGTWAPYRLCSYFADGPALNEAKIMSPFGKFLQYTNRIKETPSIVVVFTADKSRWSRSVVVESMPTTSAPVGLKCGKKKLNSLDINGNAESTTGLGWFPGFAVNAETGERLNIMFGENSNDPKNNGNDMKWNPTSSFVNATYDTLLAGGRHYIYIMNSKYDKCRRYDSLFNVGGISIFKVYKEAAWVTIPMLRNNRALLETDAKVRISVSRPYCRYSPFSPDILNPGPLEIGKKYCVKLEPIKCNGIVYNRGEVFTAAATTYSPANPLDIYSVAVFNVNTPQTLNEGKPKYTFSTVGLAPKKNQTEVGKKALDLINIVPNPYYAFSTYEKNQLDNRVKITNLPNNCSVSIFMMNGTLVRRLSRNISTTLPNGSDISDGFEEKGNNRTNLETSLDWDLKNTAGIPISSGIYIIHIDAPGLGEKVIKWFGVMRPVDLDTY